MRLDLLLVRLRFVKSRSIAQRWIGEGHMRLNGMRITRADAGIAVGAVLTLPLANGVRVILIDSLPQRRGPPSEARGCYHDLDAAAASP